MKRKGRRKELAREKYQIMIVDDDSTCLAIGKAILSMEYKVILSKSGLQALGYLQENEKPDLILMDMVMPGSSGMEIMKAIKAEEKLKNIPIIFLTGMQEDQFEIEGFQNGAVEFIPKPINAELLKIKVRNQIDILKLRRENQELKEKILKIQEHVNRVCEALYEKE